MAVKTNLTDEEVKIILAQYELGELNESVPISKGTVQTNFVIHTTKGKFILRYYENRTKESVLFEAHLIKFLNDKDYPCPDIFADRNNNYVGEFKAKPYVIFEFVEGEHLEQPNESQQRQLIEEVAKLQNLTREFDPPYKEYRWNYGLDLCRTLARQETEKINTDESRKKLEWYEDELNQIELPNSLPKGICHCDFHFSNILFKDGEFKALIDFDDANYTYLTFDLATLINPFIATFDWDSWTNFKPEDDIFDFAQARNTVSEYEKNRKLCEEEKLHLFDVYKLSIMLDCIWYFSRGNADKFYERTKIEYLNKLGRESFYKNLFEHETMTDATIRNYSHDRDIGLIAEIHQLCKEADQVDELSSMEITPTEEEIKEDLYNNHCNPETDVFISEVDGKAVGFTKVSWWNETTGVRLYLIDGLVSSDYRGQGIGLEQLRWAEKRARRIEESSTPSAKPMFGANASTTQQDRAKLLTENGYEITFSMVEMENSDLSSIREYSIPNGFELRSVEDNQLRAIWEANIKFYENRDFVGEFDEEGYQEFVEQPNKDYSLWHVAWAGDEVAGVVLSKIEKGRAEITEVGVIPKYRRKGLAQALLSLNLRTLSDRGIKTARLHTSGENVSGAQNLYQNAGFSILKRFNRYRKPM